MKTTLKQIQEQKNSKWVLESVLKSLAKTTADSEPLHLRTILETSGFSDALWCLRAVKGAERVNRLYAIWCVRQIKNFHLRWVCKNNIDHSELYANGEVKDKEWEFAYLYPGFPTVTSTATKCAVDGDASEAAYFAVFADSYDENDLVNFDKNNITALAAQEKEFIRVLDCVDAGQDPYPKSKKEGTE